jgi:hypothetical protein
LSKRLRDQSCRSIINFDVIEARASRVSAFFPSGQPSYAYSAPGAGAERSPKRSDAQAKEQRAWFKHTPSRVYQVVVPQNVVVIDAERLGALDLWRAVDCEDDVLDVLVQSRRNKRAALKLMRKLLRSPGFSPTARPVTSPAAGSTTGLHKVPMHFW